MSNETNVSNFRQIGLFLGSFSYEKSNKTVHVVEILVWHERTSNTLKTPSIICIWDCEPIDDIVPFDCVQVNFEYVEGYKGVYKKYLSYEKYEKGVCAK